MIRTSCRGPSFPGIPGREDCVIGPDTQLDNVTCGNGNTLNRVYAHDCTIRNNNTMGPFVHLRPDTDIHNHVKIGNFVEVKNSVVDDGTKLPHLIYCGDADLGKKVNFGCGTVTVNFWMVRINIEPW